MSRPEYGARIEFRATPDHVSKLDRIAARLGCSRSDFLRGLIDYAPDPDNPEMVRALVRAVEKR